MSMEPIKRWEFVEVVVPASSGATQFKFPDQPQLRDSTDQEIIIKGLEMWSASTMPFSPISQNPLATDAQLANTFFKLYVDGEDSFNFFPALKLLTQRTALATSLALFGPDSIAVRNIKIAWDKSYVNVAQPYNTGGAFAQFSILLGVSYLKLAPGTWEKLTASSPKGL